MRLKTFIFFAFSILIFVQCTADNGKLKFDTAPNEVPEKRVQLTGVIINRDIYPNTKDLKIRIPYASGGIRKEIQIISPISDDGTFYFSFELSQPQDISVDTYLDFLYVGPGDSIHIELDFKDIMNIKLSGGDAVELNNDFYRYFGETFYRKSDYNVGTECEMNCSIEEILNQLNNQRDIHRSNRNLFLQKSKVRDEVKLLTEAMIELDYYSELLQVMASRKYSYNKSIIDPKLLMEEINERVIRYFEIGLYSNSHFQFISGAYLSALYMNDQPATNKITVDWIKETTPNNTMQNFIFAAIASSALQSKNLDIFEEFYSQLDQEYLLDRLMHEYKLTWSAMNNPEIVSSYILGRANDITSSSLKVDETLLVKTIAKNRGKVLVIDVMTTWCAPCITALDEYKKLIAHYSDDNVNFVFLCANDAGETLDKIIEMKNMKKDMFYQCTQEESESLSKTFKLFAFPYGVLVNRNGVIVDYGTHVRPEIDLKSKIDHLLKYDKLLKYE